MRYDEEIPDVYVREWRAVSAILIAIALGIVVACVLTRERPAEVLRQHHHHDDGHEHH